MQSLSIRVSVCLLDDSLLTFKLWPLSLQKVRRAVECRKGKGKAIGEEGALADVKAARHHLVLHRVDPPRRILRIAPHPA